MATSYTTFRTQGSTQPKDNPDSSTEKDIRSRQIDELCKLSDDARKEVYGPNVDDETKNFYNLRYGSRKTPTWRPHIKAPQLQMLLLSDAADLTDSNVRVFINHKKSGRDKAREQAFQEHWRQENFNFALLQAQVYSEFSGTSFIQGGYDPLARDGEGSVWLRGRLPSSVRVDPLSWWPDDWNWMIVEDQVYLDDIWRTNPDYADLIKPRTARAESLAGPPAGGIEMPPGPMSVTVRGLPGGQTYMSDGTLRKRTLFCKDSSLIEPTKVQAVEFVKRNLPVPKLLPKYPRGRMIVECEGTILLDGDSWLPLNRMWPVVPVWATPPWDSVWCPSPIEFTKSLQEASEKLMSKTYENAHRLNNGVWFLPEESGVTADNFGGLPAEIVTISPNSQRMPEVKYPPPMPPQMIQLPLQYLQLQRELQGFSQSRQGNPGAGNVGADLFEASVSQSQSITKLRARLFAWSVQRAAELTFYLMSRYYTNPRVFYSNKTRQADRAIGDEK